jgi:hypothetical protein
MPAFLFLHLSLLNAYSILTRNRYDGSKGV